MRWTVCASGRGEVIKTGTSRLLGGSVAAVAATDATVPAGAVSRGGVAAATGSCGARGAAMRWTVGASGRGEVIKTGTSRLLGGSVTAVAATGSAAAAGAVTREGVAAATGSCGARGAAMRWTVGGSLMAA